MELTDLDRVTVLGLPWWETTKPNFQRFPERLRDGLPQTEDGGELLWRLSQHPTGGRLSFRTDARTLRMTFRFPPSNRKWNMSDEGERGLDLWVDGTFWRCFAPFGQEEATFTLWDGLPAAWREVMLYLPIYAPVEFISLTYDPEAAEVVPFKPAYALDKPLVVYGTSITQGGCASRPSNTWPAVLARMLNLDHVNLGFSGAAKGEAAVAKYVAEVDAACYIMDWGVNNATWQELAERYGPFLDTIREKHPETPIVCVSPVYSSTEAFSTDPRLAKMREHIRALLEGYGDKGLIYVDGYELLGPPDADGLADKTHVTDYGFRLMADRLELVVADILGLLGP